MKLLCYEMMDLQRTQQDKHAPIAPSAEIVWQLLQQQSDTLVKLLTSQTQQVRKCAPTISHRPCSLLVYMF